MTQHPEAASRRGSGCPVAAVPARVVAPGESNRMCDKRIAKHGDSPRASDHRDPLVHAATVATVPTGVGVGSVTERYPSGDERRSPRRHRTVPPRLPTARSPDERLGLATMKREQHPLRLPCGPDRLDGVGGPVFPSPAPSEPAPVEAHSWLLGERQRPARPALRAVLSGIEDRGSRPARRPLLAHPTPPEGEPLKGPRSGNSAE